MNMAKSVIMTVTIKMHIVTAVITSVREQDAQGHCTFNVGDDQDHMAKAVIMAVTIK